MKESIRDTIAAIATSAGEGGIGMVRISGKDALTVAGSLFCAKNGIDISTGGSHGIYYGHIVKDGGEPVDEVLLTVMRAPKTYTREDVVEINCHGGAAALKAVLELIVNEGARLAEPGEFTRRAFLNGRIDLTQAEAVLDVVMAKTGAGLGSAVALLEGRLSKKVVSILDRLMEVYTDLTAVIDFPDDVENQEMEAWRRNITGAAAEIDELIASYHNGAVLRNGISAVICGKPNVGKSSLMNILLGHNRVIVAPHPGTTRDAIEETVSIRGIAMRLMDTAGIGAHSGDIEKDGMERSRSYIERADLILFMLDGSGALDGHDRGIAKTLNGKKVIAVINKTDLPPKLDSGEVMSEMDLMRCVAISCLKDKGMAGLESAIYDSVWSGEVYSSGQILVSSVRQKEDLLRAANALKAVRDGIVEDASYELISSDMRAAVDALGDIVGRTFSEDILDRVFSKFCIGK